MTTASEAARRDKAARRRAKNAARRGPHPFIQNPDTNWRTGGKHTHDRERARRRRQMERGP